MDIFQSYKKSDLYIAFASSSLKKNVELPYDPAVPLLGIYTEENHNLKINIPRGVHCSTIYNSQDVEPTEMSIDREWIKKMWYINIVEYYSAIRR